MTSILSEKEYQHFIMDRLSQDNSYIVRKATSYDRLFAMDRELLFQFIQLLQRFVNNPACKTTDIREGIFSYLCIVLNSQ